MFLWKSVDGNTGMVSNSQINESSEQASPNPTSNYEGDDGPVDVCDVPLTESQLLAEEKDSDHGLVLETSGAETAGRNLDIKNSKAQLPKLEEPNDLVGQRLLARQEASEVEERIMAEVGQTLATQEERLRNIELQLAGTLQMKQTPEVIARWMRGSRLIPEFKEMKEKFANLNKVNRSHYENYKDLMQRLNSLSSFDRKHTSAYQQQVEENKMIKQDCTKTSGRISACELQERALGLRLSALARDVTKQAEQLQRERHELHGLYELHTKYKTVLLTTTWVAILSPVFSWIVLKTLVLLYALFRTYIY